MPWAKERMPELFEGAKIIENGEDLIKITKVDTMNGECHINTRKGKIFHFFEFEIKLKWSGKHTHTRATLISIVKIFRSSQRYGSASAKPGTIKGDKVEGNFDMPEISFENDMDEHEVQPQPALFELCECHFD